MFKFLSKKNNTATNQITTPDEKQINNELKNLPILSFKSYEKNREIYIDFDTATKNICVLGGTGTGKTTTVCYPALYKLAKNNCSGLILDIKGGYSNFARTLNQKFKDKIEIFGVYDHCKKINLIAGISPYKLREFLGEAVSSNRTKDSYWGMNGIEDFVLIYEILKEKKSEISPTLADLYYLFNSPFELQELSQISSLSFDLYRKIKFRQNTDRFSIFNENHSETASEQRTWQFSAILKALKPFYEDKYIREYFCNSEAISFKHKIYEENKIIVLDLPSSIYGDTSVFVSQILRAMFKDTVKNQTESWLQSNGYGTIKFTFLLIDEYQQFINNNSSPTMDDNNWFDTSRGYGNINIICTQSIDSLINKTNEAYTEQLIGNCRNIIHLPTHAKYSIENIVNLSSKIFAETLKHQKNQTAYIYIGQNQDRVGTSELIQMGQSKDKIMNFFISKEYKNATLKMINTINQNIEYKNYYFPYEIDFEIDKTINTWEDCPEPEHTIDKKLYIITSQNKSSGFLDFNYIINQEKTIFKEVNVYSNIYKNEIPNSFINNLAIEKGDLLLFIRGGGDMKESFLNTKEFENDVMRLNKNGVIIGVGYGHVDDSFHLKKFIKIPGITPTDLAYKIISKFPKTPISRSKTETNPELNDTDKEFTEQISSLFSD